MKTKIVMLMMVLLSSLTSCLTMGLDELPAYKDADINKFMFEYRWWNEDDGHMEVMVLSTESKVDKDAKTVTCEITVPPVKAPFTEDIRDKVTQSNLLGYCNISTAAIIAPKAGSAALGKMQDWSKGINEYVVTAADGTKKTWKVEIVKFSK